MEGQAAHRSCLLAAGLWLKSPWWFSQRILLTVSWGDGHLAATSGSDFFAPSSIRYYGVRVHRSGGGPASTCRTAWSSRKLAVFSIEWIPYSRVPGDLRNCHSGDAVRLRRWHPDPPVPAPLPPPQASTAVVARPHLAGGPGAGGGSRPGGTRCRTRVSCVIPGCWRAATRGRPRRAAVLQAAAPASRSPGRHDERGPTGL